MHTVVDVTPAKFKGKIPFLTGLTNLQFNKNKEQPWGFLGCSYKTFIAGSLESATWFTGGLVEVFLTGGGEKNQDFMLIRL